MMSLGGKRRPGLGGGLGGGLHTSGSSAFSSPTATRRQIAASSITGLNPVGVWFPDEYSATPRPHIPNAMGTGAVSANLSAAPRRLFANTNYWTRQQISAVTDDAATAPDGSNEASTLVTNAANWTFTPYGYSTIPAGTYTIAINAKRNTGSDQAFAFTKDNTATRSATKTATSDWQRFSYTFTIASATNPAIIGLCSSDGSTAANIQICDCELFSGSSDLGPGVCDGHLYLGQHAFDTRPAYSGGELNLSTGGFGLAQLSESASVTQFTAIALVSKVAAGSSVYHSFLTKVQSYTAFSATVEVSKRAQAWFGGSSFLHDDDDGMWELLNVGYHTLTHRYDGTTLSFWLDDILLFQSAQTVAAITLRDLWVGALNALTCGEKVAGAIALYDYALTDTQVRTVHAAMVTIADESSLTAPASTRIYCAEGDSITADGTNSAYPFRFGPNASPAILGCNFAFTGSTLATLTSRAGTVDAVIPPSKDGRTFILSILIGRNGLQGYSGGASQYAADVATYCAARKAAGWDKVVLCTVLPATAVGYNAERNAFNAIVTAGGWAAANSVDAICDFAADATMGPDAAASDLTYYSDGTHPTAAGQVILETVLRAVVNAL